MIFALIYASLFCACYFRTQSAFETYAFAYVFGHFYLTDLIEINRIATVIPTAKESCLKNGNLTFISRISNFEIQISVAIIIACPLNAIFIENTAPSIRHTILGIKFINLIK